MGRDTREVWRKRVERWGDSNLTAREFGAEIGVNPRTLTYWKWQLNKEQREAAAGREKIATQRPSATKRTNVDFIEVPAAAVDEQSDAAFELTLPGGIGVRVPAGFDSESLRRLVQLLRAC